MSVAEEIIDQTVSVTRNGQATIPKEIREKLGISAPGKVRFKLDEHQELTVEKVPHPSEFKGMGADSTEGPYAATRELRSERQKEKERDDRLLGDDE